MSIVAPAIAAMLISQAASAAATSWPLAVDGMLRGAATGDVTQADGILPAGVTVFDDEYPGIARLSPDLLSALRAAARQSVLVLTVSNGTLLMASGTPMGVPLPSGITDSDIVYLN